MNIKNKHQQLPLVLIGTSLACSSAKSAVLFSETFENPITITQTIPTGPFTFDNTWNIISESGNGVALLSSPQRITLGFSDSNVINSLDITIPGFTEIIDPTMISFEHISDGANNTQFAQVLITDPSNSDAILYDSGPLLNSITVNNATFTPPTGDTINILIQHRGGSTISSDNSFDNIMITTVPEPSSSLLITLAGIGFLQYRRR